MNYNVFEHIGAYCITLDDGQKVYAAIHPELKAHERVELDFRDVEIVASPFLNAAIGQLLRDLSPEALNTHLKISNLSVLARPVLARVIENAKTYYSNPEYHEAVDRVIEKEVNAVNDD
jgi:hypothetical protein